MNKSSKKVENEEMKNKLNDEIDVDADTSLAV